METLYLHNLSNNNIKFNIEALLVCENKSGTHNIILFFQKHANLRIFHSGLSACTLSTNTHPEQSWESALRAVKRY